MPEEVPYVWVFQDYGDKVTTTSYLLWRRFDRVGFDVDILTLDPVLRGTDNRELLFEGFSRREVGTIQLGRLTAIGVESHDQSQALQYSGLRDYFIGRILYFDAIEAIRGANSYTVEEILAVEEQYSVFDFRYREDILGGIKEAQWLFGLLRPSNDIINEALDKGLSELPKNETEDQLLARIDEVCQGIYEEIESKTATHGEPPPWLKDILPTRESIEEAIKRGSKEPEEKPSEPPEDGLLARFVEGYSGPKITFKEIEETVEQAMQKIDDLLRSKM